MQPGHIKAYWRRGFWVYQGPVWNIWSPFCGICNY